MGLTAIFMNASLSGTDTAASQKSASVDSSKSFDSFMNSIDSRDTAQKTAPKEKAANSQRNDSNQKTKNKADDARGNRIDNKKDDNMSSSSANSSDDNSIENEKPVQAPVKESKSADDSKESKVDLNSDDEKLVNELASVLDISLDSVMEILASLNMTPADLTDNNNLNLFMQKVFGAGSAIELLETPNIAQTFKEVSALLEDYGRNNAFNETLTGDSNDKLNAVISPEQTADSNAEADTFQSNLNTTAQQQAISDALTQETEPEVQEAGGYVQETPGMEAATSAVLSRGTSNGNTGGNFQDQQTDVDQNFLANLLNNVPEVKDSVNSARLETANEASRSINTQDVINQIVDKMKVDVSDNASEIRITLKPEHLGDVSLKITTQNGIVTAQFVAENQRIKEIIESNASQLRSALQEQGIDLFSLNVTVGQDGNQERMEHFLRGQQSQAARSGRLNSLRTAGAESEDEDNYTDPTDKMGYRINYTA